jgi:hypothetical protein
MASNQMKNYEDWKVRAEAVAETYKIETQNIGTKCSKDNKELKWFDLQYGWIKVFNYADAMQYFGLSDGVNRYKAVYNQVGTYLTEPNLDLTKMLEKFLLMMKQ